jgi:hypothetical protein
LQDETAAEFAAQATELIPALRRFVGATHMARIDDMAMNIGRRIGSFDE